LGFRLAKLDQPPRRDVEEKCAEQIDVDIGYGDTRIPEGIGAAPVCDLQRQIAPVGVGHRRALAEGTALSCTADDLFGCRNQGRGGSERRLLAPAMLLAA